MDFWEAEHRDWSGKSLLRARARAVFSDLYWTFLFNCSYCSVGGHIKKNAGLRKLCICFTFQTQKHHPSHILSSCKQSSFYKKVLKFESLHNPNIICDLFCSSKIDVHFWQYLQAQHTLYSSRSTSLLALLSATMVARSRVRESSCLGAVTSVFRSVHMGSDHQDALECCMWTGSVFPCALS